MREWMKAVGQLSGGAGLLLVAYAFLLRVSRSHQERAGELKGILTLLVKEIAGNVRTADRFSREPQRLIAAREGVLATGAWERSCPRLGSLSVDPYFFSLLSQYYENVSLVNQEMRHGVNDREDMEKLQDAMTECHRMSRSVSDRVRQYVATLSGIEHAKPA